jgi:DHA1 family bicyclomycin/chloramphenicol resistance-like MFS transporter
MVRDLADGKEAASLMSDVLQVMSIAPVIAPVVGSMLLKFADWRMIFIVAALYGMVGLYVLVRYLPETLPFSHRRTVGLIPAIRVCGIILCEPGFLVHASIGAFGMAALFAYLAGAPSVFMDQDGISPTAFGFLLAILGTAMVGFFRINGWLVRRWSVVLALNIGIGAWFLAGVTFCALAWTGTAAAPAAFLVLLLFSLGYSFIPSNAQVGALSRHGEHAATATALMSTLQYSVGALAGALVGLLADGTARPMAGIMLLCALGAACATVWSRRGTVAP